MKCFVNVDVALHEGESWLLIVRGEKEEHAPGTLSLVGGTFEGVDDPSAALEETARREVKEEVGVVLSNALDYVESTYFVSDTGAPVLNVVFMAALDGQQPTVCSQEEVAGLAFRTADEVTADDRCPPWTKQSIRAAAALRAARSA